MIVHTDHRGRTAGGRYTARLIEMEPDDFPPDSLYWKACAREAGARFVNQFGRDAYDALVDGMPDDFVWRDLVVEIENVLSCFEHSTAKAGAA